MFERFTERARRVLFFARYEASLMGSGEIRTVHLLLGAARETTKSSSSVLRRAGLSVDSIRLAISRLPPVPDKMSTSVDIPFSKNTKRALQCAAEEADRLHHHVIGVEHLLLGVLCVADSSGAAILTAQGMTISDAREAIVARDSDAEHSEDRDSPLLSADDPRLLKRLGIDPPEGFGSHQRSIPENVSFMNIRIGPSRKDARGCDVASDGSWVVEGVSLSSMLVTLCECPPRRLEIHDLLDEGRHDFVMSYAARLTRAQRNQLMLDFIKLHFRITVERERREVAAFVLSAPDGPGPELKPAEETDPLVGAIQGFAMGLEIADASNGEAPHHEPDAQQGRGELWKKIQMRIWTARGIPTQVSMPGGTMGTFATLLEIALGRPVVDETGLNGRFDLEMTEPQPAGAAEAGREAFLTELRQRFGIDVSPAKRLVEFVVVKPVRR